jgi:hypothetical protein
LDTAQEDGTHRRLNYRSNSRIAEAALSVGGLVVSISARNAFFTANVANAGTPARGGLTLRRIIWDDGKPSLDPEDYSVIADGEKIGRIYRTRGAGVETKWLWAIYGRGSALADSLDEAKAAFKAACDAHK